ncbi:tRNA 3'-trailer sequence RNase, putative, partial [Hepatocystis sp. ex Piliocolobus tephrosceles]
KNLNIPPGKYYGILKSGKCITINNKLIKPEDVCDNNIDGKKSLVIDILNINEIHNLIKEIQKNEYYNLKNLEYIFHLSDEEILNNQTYQDFFKKFENVKNVKNIKCNQSNKSLSVCPFISSSSLNNFLSNLLPGIFLEYKADTPIYNNNPLFVSNHICINKKELKQIQPNGYIMDNKKNMITIDHDDVNYKGVDPNKNDHNHNDNSNNNSDNNKSLKSIVSNGIITNSFIQENQQIVTNNEKKLEHDEKYLKIYNPLTKFILHPFHKINICEEDILSDL